LQACSQAIYFIPDLDDIVALAPLVEQAQLSSTTLQAAKNFDSQIVDLVKYFTDSTEYLKVGASHKYSRMERFRRKVN
jgi:WASH complex subunit 7